MRTTQDRQTASRDLALDDRQSWGQSIQIGRKSDCGTKTTAEAVTAKRDLWSRSKRVGEDEKSNAA